MATSLALDVHVVNDLGQALTGAEVEATLTWPGGGRRWRFGGEAAGRACTFVGRLRATLPAPGALPALAGDAPPRFDEDRGAGPSWPLVLELRLWWGASAEPVTNRYRSSLRA